MAYKVVMPYHLHMPSYFLETFTEYPYLSKQSKEKEGVSSFAHLLSENPFFADKECMAIICFILTI